VKTDWRGYAIVPYATPYRRNHVQLDPETLPDNVDLALNNQNVVPTRGAVVRANFDASVGQRALMIILRAGGAPVPFGAMVTDPAQKGAQAFIVGDGGQVYLTGLEDSGVLQVKWGNEAGEQCSVQYSLNKQTADNAGVQTLSGHCQ
jgi:outer membrane usher protein